MELALRPLRRYLDFAGRSSRAEFWLFALFVFIATMILTLLDQTLNLGGYTYRTWDIGDWYVAGRVGYSGGWLTWIFSFAILVPSIALAVRRLHDANHSGWWLLLAFVPGIGWFVLLVFYLQRSWPLPNRWGEPATPSPSR